jgi:hypothetical protein
VNESIKSSGLKTKNQLSRGGKYRMKKMLLLAFLVVIMIALIGCGGGGSSNSFTSKYAGAWVGTWNIPSAGQSGDITIIIASNGDLSGSMYNSTTSSTASLTGTSTNSDFSFTYQYNGSGSGSVTGTFTESGTHLLGTFKNKFSGITYDGSFDVTKQSPTPIPTPAPTSAPAKDLLHEKFETNINDWSMWANSPGIAPTYERVNNISGFSGYCLHFSSSYCGNVFWDEGWSNNNLFALKAGKTYTIMFNAKAKYEGYFYLILQNASNRQGYYLSGAIWISNTSLPNEPRFYIRSFTCSNNDDSCQLVICFGNENGRVTQNDNINFYIDDIIVREQ